MLVEVARNAIFFLSNSTTGKSNTKDLEIRYAKIADA
jgi:hypothetical protein